MRVGVSLAAERLRLVGASLPPAQLAEPDESIRGHPRSFGSQRRRRRFELHFGFVPRAAGEQDARVLGAAGRHHRVDGPPRTHIRHRPAPGVRPLEVTRAIAGGDDVAEDEGAEERIFDLARHHGGARLVQERRAGVDLSHG